MKKQIAKQTLFGALLLALILAGGLAMAGAEEVEVKTRKVEGER